MGILDRMFSPREKVREVTGTESESVVTSASYADMTSQVNSQMKALSIGAYYRALTLCAQTFGQMIPEYQKCDRSTGGNFVADNYGAGRRLN